MDWFFRKRRHYLSRKHTKSLFPLFFKSHMDSQRPQRGDATRLRRTGLMHLHLISDPPFRSLIDDYLKLQLVTSIVFLKLRELIKCITSWLSDCIYWSLTILPKMPCDLQSCKFFLFRGVNPICSISFYIYIFSKLDLRKSVVVTKGRPRCLMPLSFCCLADGRWSSWKCLQPSQLFCCHVKETAI